MTEGETNTKTIKYRAFSVRNFRRIPQIENLTEEDKRTIEVVGNVLPFKVNNYVIDELIDWDNYKNDPIFHLTFPQKGMLEPEDFHTMEQALNTTDKRMELRDRKSTRLNSSHVAISYAVFCLKKKKHTI